MKKAFNIAFIAAGLLLCFALAVCFLLLGPSAAGANETLSPPPEILDAQGRLNAEYLGDAADYYGDHFSFRQEMIDLYAKLNAGAFSVSASDEVILGRDGWLYYAPTLADYAGTEAMTDAEIADAAANLLLLQDYCRERGMAFCFAPVPNKNTLYDENMPATGARSGLHDLERLTDKLRETGVVTADIYSAFASEDEVLYFAHDSHWTSRGAALGADLINAALGRESDFFGGDFAAVERHDGDLYAMLYPTSVDPERDISPVTAPAFEYAAGGGTRPDSISIRTTGGGEGALLAFRDSFGNSLYPYLASSCASAVFSRSVNYNMTMASATGADAVLIELVERNLDYLIRNIPVMPAPERELGEPEISGETAISGTPAGATLPGYTLWEGKTENRDDGSAVCVLTDGGAYECFRLVDGAFAAYVPENLTATAVAFWQDGVLTALAAKPNTEG